MVSVIICSRSSNLLNAVTENIAATIGVPFEVISIDNRQGTYGICEAYNTGAAKSQFDTLCFMHEDVKLFTPGWGKKVQEILADTNIGVLGVAGGKLNPGQSPLHVNTNPRNERISDVVALDGVWLCCPKKVWQNHPFDAQTFKEFHFYDVDFTMQIAQRYRACVTYDIHIEHFSHGSINSSWARNAIRFSEKWKSKLPFTLEPVDSAKLRELEYTELHNFLKLIRHLEFEKEYIVRYAWKCLRIRPDDQKSRRIVLNDLQERLPGMYGVVKKIYRNLSR
jgi:hypothetical protein